MKYTCQKMMLCPTDKICHIFRVKCAYRWAYLTDVAFVDLLHSASAGYLYSTTPLL